MTAIDGRAEWTPEKEAAAALAIPDDSDKGRPVRIRWTDSGMEVHGWQQSADVADHVMPAIETVGMWLGESDTFVMVAGSHDTNNDNWGECQLIWKPAITLIEWLDNRAAEYVGGIP